MPFPVHALQLGTREVVASHDTLPLHTTGTFEAWLRLGTLDKGTQTVARLGALPVVLSVSGRVLTLTAGPNTLRGATELDPNRWYHLACRWDGATGLCDLFVDGLVDARGPIDVVADAGLQIGSNFLGQLAVARLWSVARSAASLRAAAYGEVEHDADGLIGAWQLGEVQDGQIASTLVGGAALTLEGSYATAPSSPPDFNLTPALPPTTASAIALAGSRAHVRLPDTTRLGLAGSSFTVEAWLRLSELSTVEDPALGSQDLKGSGRFQAGLSRGRALLRLGASETLGATRLQPGVWTHLAWRYDAETGATTVFVHGVPDGSRNGAPALPGDLPLALGRAGRSQYLQGDLAEVRLWSVARTDAEIAAGVSEPPEANAPALTAYWRPGELAGATVPDRGTQGHFGVLEGSTQVLTAEGVPVGPKPPRRVRRKLYLLSRTSLYSYDERTRALTPIGALRTRSRPVTGYDLAFTADGVALLAGESQIHRLDLDTGECTPLPARSPGYVYSLARLSDGRVLGMGFGRLAAIDPVSGAETLLQRPANENYSALTELPDGSLLCHVPGRWERWTVAGGLQGNPERAATQVSGLTYSNDTLFGVSVTLPTALLTIDPNTLAVQTLESFDRTRVPDGLIGVDADPTSDVGAL